MVGKAIKDPEKLKIIASNPRRYTGRPRVGTMRELQRQCEYVQNNFDKVTIPFLTAHGTSDGLACASGSEKLYEKASSEDKTLKLYEGMYHSLIQGEPDENANVVLGDMRAWIDERVERHGPKCNRNWLKIKERFEFPYISWSYVIWSSIIVLEKVIRRSNSVRFVSMNGVNFVIKFCKFGCEWWFGLGLCNNRYTCFLWKSFSKEQVNFNNGLFRKITKKVQENGKRK